MKMWIKRVGANIGVAAAGIVFIGTYGVVTLGRNCAEVSDQPRASEIVSIAATETKAEPKAIKTTPATQVYEIVDYRKASVSEYDMSVVKASKKKEEKTDPNNFEVKFPETELEYYDNMNSPLGFTSVRSIADEYYTVNDIISGSQVTLNGHELICQIVYSEISDSWDNEAIKAQAVAAYSYIRFNDALGSIPTVGLKQGYTSKIESCVNAVEGQVMTYNGKIINAVYSASTAGYSTTSLDVWGVSYPYLQVVKSQYDDQDPNWGLETKYTKEEVKDIIEKELGFELSDDIQNWFKIESAYSGKYIKNVSIDGHSSYTNNGNTTSITGKTLCNLFDIKSNAIDISYKDGVFTFKSYGWGHGVGMSQWGACLYAKNGYTYDQILTHYYVGASLALSDVNSSAVVRGQQAQEESENAVTTSTDSTESSSSETEQTENTTVTEATTTTSAPQTETTVTNSTAEE
ncbi:MAG: SpoIID/LytB domain-containing protein [Hominimerdicola sp.]